jgi:hypothetical protein
VWWLPHLHRHQWIVPEYIRTLDSTGLTFGGEVVSSTHTGLYPEKDLLVIILVRSWENPRVMVRLEGLGKLKQSLTSSELKPTTLRLVAYRLNLPRYEDFPFFYTGVVGTSSSHDDRSWCQTAHRPWELCGIWRHHREEMKSSVSWSTYSTLTMLFATVVMLFSHYPFSCPLLQTQNITETAFCLRFQVQRNQLRLIDKLVSVPRLVKLCTRSIVLILIRSGNF